MYRNSSTKLSSSYPSLTLVENWPCDCFGRTSTHTVFVVLYALSWGPSYARHTSKSVFFFFLRFYVEASELFYVASGLDPRVSEEQLPWVQVTPHHPHNSLHLPRHLLHNILLLLLGGDGLGHLYIHYTTMAIITKQLCLSTFNDTLPTFGDNFYTSPTFSDASPTLNYDRLRSVTVHLR